LKITLSNSELTATINTFGAELISLKNSNKKEYIWDGNPDYWGKHSPILFPIVGSLKNNSYSYNTTTYNLPRHGFAREMEFDIIEKNHYKVVFSLKETATTLEKYPFKFELQISYTLTNSVLKVGFKVINNNHIPIEIPSYVKIYTLPQERNYSEQPYELQKTLRYVN
jgi:galactose mutarotase-like enzyme